MCASITSPRTFGRGIGARKSMFVRLYSATFAGASTGEVGGATGGTGADGARGDPVDGGANVIGATVALEIDAISLDFIRSRTIKTVGQAVAQP